jgi:predicted glycosyl hydrolase (DUF1957 family)
MGTKREDTNNEQIPAELKMQLTEKVTNILNNINKVDKAISSAIDDLIESEDVSLTVTEIQAGLLNVMKKFNSKEITQLVK